MYNGDYRSSTAATMTDHRRHYSLQVCSLPKTNGAQSVASRGVLPVWTEYFGQLRLGGVGGDTNLAGGAHERVALECDDIRPARIVEKLSVHGGQRRVRQKHEESSPSGTAGEGNGGVSGC